MNNEPTHGGSDESDATPPPSEATDDPIRTFVEHWGMMARAWGINATMGEIFALLYITGTEWTADALRQRLFISRGNVSMNLRELLNWGVVHKVHRQGERREFFRAEGDVWTLFRRILRERKRRELEPTLGVLDRTAHLVSERPELRAIHDRVSSLLHFFNQVDRITSHLDMLDREDLEALGRMFDASSDPPS